MAGETTLKINELTGHPSLAGQIRVDIEKVGYSSPEYIYIQNVKFVAIPVEIVPGYQSYVAEINKDLKKDGSLMPLQPITISRYLNL
ncbi:MAG: hypothetical protein HC921_18785 [Synechococcaceae cyanobacterium SM2_3_1]|nr:hypothetical protein [Synechococcaceae cyanobacterium SM2_3_1]